MAHPGITQHPTSSKSTPYRPFASGVPLSFYVSAHHHCIDEGLGRMTCSGGRVNEIDPDFCAVIQIVRRHQQQTKGSAARHHASRDSAALLEDDFEKTLEDAERLHRLRQDADSSLAKRISLNLAIANGIRTLLLSKNFIESIAGIVVFQNVVKLSLQANKIRSIHQCTPLQFLPKLQFLSMEYNPVCQLPFYRTHIIAICDRRGSPLSADSGCAKKRGGHEESRVELLRHLDDHAVTPAERATVPATLRREQAFLLSAMQDFVTLQYLDAARRKLQLHAELFATLVQRGVVIAPAQQRSWSRSFHSASGAQLATFTDSNFNIDLFLKLCASALGFAIPPYQVAHEIRREVVAAHTQPSAQSDSIAWEDAFAAVGSSLHTRAIKTLLELEQATPRAAVREKSSIKQQQPLTDDPRQQLFRRCFVSESERAKVLTHWYKWYEAAAGTGEAPATGELGAPGAEELRNAVVAQAATQGDAAPQDPEIDPISAQTRCTVEFLTSELELAREREAELQRINCRLRVHLDDYRRANDLTISRVGKMPSSIGGDVSSVDAAARSDVPIPLPYPGTSPMSEATVSHIIHPFQEKEAFLNAEIESLRVDNEAKQEELRHLEDSVSELQNALQQESHDSQHSRSIIAQLEEQISALRKEILERSQEASVHATHVRHLQREQYRSLSLQSSLSDVKRQQNAAATSFCSERIRRYAFQFWRKSASRRAVYSSARAMLLNARMQTVTGDILLRWRDVACFVSVIKQRAQQRQWAAAANCLSFWRMRTRQRRDEQRILRRRAARCRLVVFHHWKSRSAVGLLHRQRESFLNAQADTVHERELKHSALKRWMCRLAHHRANVMCEELCAAKFSNCVSTLTSKHDGDDGVANLSWSFASGFVQSTLPDPAALHLQKILLFHNWRNRCHLHRTTRRFQLRRPFCIWRSLYLLQRSERVLSEQIQASLLSKCYQCWKNRLIEVLLVDSRHHQDLQLEAALRLEQMQSEQKSAENNATMILSASRNTQRAAVEAMGERTQRNFLSNFFSMWREFAVFSQQLRVHHLLSEAIQSRRRAVRARLADFATFLSRQTVKSVFQTYFVAWMTWSRTRKMCRELAEECGRQTAQLSNEKTCMQELLAARDSGVPASVQTALSYAQHRPEDDDCETLAVQFHRQKLLSSAFHLWLASCIRCIRCHLSKSIQAERQHQDRAIDLATNNVKLVHTLHELAARLAQAAALNEEQQGEASALAQAIRELRAKELHDAEVRHMQERSISKLQAQLDHATRDNMSLHTALQIQTAQSIPRGGGNVSAESKPAVVYPHSLPPPTPPRHEDIEEREIPHNVTPPGRRLPPEKREFEKDDAANDGSVSRLLQQARSARAQLHTKEQFLRHCRNELERLSESCL